MVSVRVAYLATLKHWAKLEIYDGEKNLLRELKVREVSISKADKGYILTYDPESDSGFETVDDLKLYGGLTDRVKLGVS